MKKPLTPLMVALCFASGTASAADIDFSGFLSAGGGLVDDSNAGYLGFDDDLSFETDGVFGLQANVKVDQNLSMTAQIVARGIEQYDPKVEWAFAAYKFSDAFTARAGRLRAPFYLVSEYLEVGYAYPWIRPPQEAYWIPFSAVDGVDGTYRIPFGESDLSLRAYYGNYQDDVFGGADAPRLPADLKKLMGFTATFNYDWLTLRAGHHSTDVTIDLDPQGTGLNQLIAALNANGFTAAAKDIDTDNIDTTFDEVAVQIDYGKFLAIAEATAIDFEDSGLLQDRDSWYTTLGFRPADEHLLHLTYASIKHDIRDMTRNIPNLPVPQLQALRATVQGAAQATDNSQRSLTLGWRWNFSDSADVKIEWQRIKPEDNTIGQLDRGTIGEEVNVYSFVVDLVF